MRDIKNMAISKNDAIVVDVIDANVFSKLLHNREFWLITSDGKWSLHYNVLRMSLTVVDTSQFFKSGNTTKYKAHGDRVTNHHVESFYKIYKGLVDGESFDHPLLEKCFSRKEEIKNKSDEAYNPYSTSRIKPFVFKGVDKFRRDDVVKILVNHQYIRVKNDYSYTDDYAYDAENNFFKDVEVGANDFLVKYLYWNQPHVWIDNDGKLVNVEYGGSKYSIILP